MAVIPVLSISNTWLKGVRIKCDWFGGTLKDKQKYIIFFSTNEKKQAVEKDKNTELRNRELEYWFCCCVAVGP